MKTLPAPAMAALKGRRPIIAGALRLSLDTPQCVWSGHGKITIESQEFVGVAARALIAPISTQVGGAADGAVITLSGLDPHIAQTIEEEDYHQKPVTIWRLFFGEDRKTLLGVRVFMRGRLDFVTQRESVGGAVALDFHVEGPRRDMNRAGSRLRSDTDQRALGGAADGAFRYVSYAGSKTLYWGQKPTPGKSKVDGANGGFTNLPPMAVFK